MVEVTLERRADDLLRELTERGLVVKLEAIDKRRQARHWHLGFAGRSGVLEVTELGAACELKVAERRDGGWAIALVGELSAP